MATKPTTTEIAKQIDAHLKAAEADAEWNRRTDRYEGSKFFHATCWRAGRWVLVTYVSYQGRTPLTREEAERYLAWLDAGNRGRHFEALRS